MHPFAYLKAPDTATVVASGADHRSDHHSGTSIDLLAGGTDLLQLLQERVRTPTQVIDITALPGMAGIDVSDSGITLGALVRMSDAAGHPAVQERCPVVVEALLASASPQVRNLATLGGNLLQRTRCGYFRDAATPCNKRVPGSGCPAADGVHRNHAILGTSDSCFATYASDLAVALVALDAELQVTGPSGARSIVLAELHRLPGDTPWIETRLAPGELITAITVPDSPASRRSHYLKVRDRTTFEWALASAAVAVELDERDRVVDARVAVGGVATVPWRLTASEQALRGRELTREVCDLAATSATAGARPHPGNAYKLPLIRSTVARALRQLGGLA